MVSYHFEAGLADLVEVLEKEQLLRWVGMEPLEIQFFHMLHLVAVVVEVLAAVVVHRVVAEVAAVVVHRAVESLEDQLIQGLLAQVFGQSLQQLFGVAKADFWPKICKPLFVLSTAT